MGSLPRAYLQKQFNHSLAKQNGRTILRLMAYRCSPHGELRVTLFPLMYATVQRGSIQLSMIIGHVNSMAFVFLPFAVQLSGRGSLVIKPTSVGAAPGPPAFTTQGVKIGSELLLLHSQCAQ